VIKLGAFLVSVVVYTRIFSQPRPHIFQVFGCISLPFVEECVLTALTLGTTCDAIAMVIEVRQ
jgi:hypothetical protein